MLEGARSALSGALVFGEKLPGVLQREWRRLRELFPDCGIINMNRDVDACAWSAISKNWWPFDPRPHDAIEAAEWEQHWLGILRQHAEDGLAEIRQAPDVCWVELDELNSDPERVVHGVLDYVGLPVSAYPFSKMRVFFEPGHCVS